MTRSSGPTSGWLTRYFRFSLLYIIHISTFHCLFARARPAPSNPVPCKGRHVEGVVYMLDTDNHLAQRFPGTECHMIRKQNVRRGEFDNVESESVVFSTENEMTPLMSVTSADEVEKFTVLNIDNDYNTRGETGEALTLTSQPTTLSVSPGISQSGPYESFIARSSDDYSAMLGQGDSVVGYPATTITLAVPLESAGGITTDSYTWSVDNPSIFWSTTTIKPTDVIEQTSDQKLMSGDFNSLAVSSNETLVSPSGSHNSSAFSKDFNYVVGMAIALGLSMAMPALILICALSKKGQYIWVRTVNFTGVQLPNVEHGYYSGASGAPSGRGSESTNRSDITPSHDIDSTNRSSSQDIERISRPETVFDLNRSGIASRNDTEGAGRSEVATRHDIESANRSGASMNRPGGFQKWFGSTGNSNMRKSGVFQRWFGWCSEKRVNFEETPSSSYTRQGHKIHSVRTRTRDGIPDTSFILAEAAERLARGRMRQLSTVFSVGEEEEAESNIVLAREEELSSISSTRAVTSGSVVGTQRQNSTVKRNRQGVLETFGNMGGVGVSAGCAVADGNNTREENQEGEPENSEGSDPRASLSTRFDNSTDKGKGKARGTYRRVSIRQYLLPTVEDDKPSTGEVSPLENNVFEMNSETVIRRERKGERASDLWGGMFGDPAAVSIGSTISGGTSTKLERQPKRGCESGNHSSGSSIGDDSTLAVSSNGDVELVKTNNQLPMEDGPGSGDAVYSSGFGMSGDPVLNQFFRAQSTTSEGVVSAFGVRAKSLGWGSQTSSEDGQSSNYFTGSSSGYGNEMDFNTSTPVDHMKGARTEGEEAMHGEPSTEN